MKRRNKKLILTPELKRAIAHDDVNRQMRKAGRKVWNRDDYNLAVRVLNELLDDKGD